MYFWRLRPYEPNFGNSPNSNNCCHAGQVYQRNENECQCEEINLSAQEVQTKATIMKVRLVQICFSAVRKQAIKILLARNRADAVEKPLLGPLIEGRSM